MVEYKNDDHNLDRIFHALADPTRRGLLQQLQAGESCVTELASQYEVSLNAISKHLKVLEKAELIQRNIQGRVHYCAMNSEKLKEIEKWMQPYKKFWQQSLDDLENYMIKKKGD